MMFYIIIINRFTVKLVKDDPLWQKWPESIGLFTVKLGYGGVDCVCFAVRWILLRCNANVDPDPGSKKSAGKNKNNNTKFTGKILNFVFVFSDFWNCFRQFLPPWSASSLRILIQEVSHNADADPHHCHICTAGWTMLVSTGRTGSTPVSWLSLVTRL